MNCPYSAPPISLDNRKVNGTGAADGKAKLYVLDIAANNPAIFTAESFPPIFDWLRPTFGSKKLGWQPFQSLPSQLSYLIWYINRINEIFNGRPEITGSTALRLAKYWQVSPYFRLNLQIRYDHLPPQGARSGLPTPHHPTPPSPHFIIHNS